MQITTDPKTRLALKQGIGNCEVSGENGTRSYDITLDMGSGDILVQNELSGTYYRAHLMSIVEDVVDHEAQKDMIVDPEEVLP